MKLLMINKKLPIKCGEAYIKFDRFAKRPTKKGSTITIPLNENVDFIPLNPVSRGDQFFIENSVDCHYEYYFGGTDNNPEKTVFLAQIKKSSFDIFKQHGEDAFYDSLVPKVIRHFSQRTNSNDGNNWIFKRQGCIFAIKFPCPWGTVKDCRDFLFGGDVEFKKAEKEVIFSTKHLFTGNYISVNRSDINRVGRGGKRKEWQPYIIGQGIISSAIATNNNLSLDLTKSLHIISRAVGLVYSYNPDNEY